MSFFHYRDSALYAESVSLSKIAEEIGTPTYVYSQSAIEAQWEKFQRAFDSLPHSICYAVKANSNLHILSLLASMGAGFDIVSRGELERVLTAGGDPHKIVFSGVAKSVSDIERALEVRILAFNVESLPELKRIHQVAAQKGLRAPVILRMNPDVDPKTHPYISTGLKENKFGMAVEEVLHIGQSLENFSAIEFLGVGCHIGSQILEPSPFFEALEKVLEVAQQLQSGGMNLKFINLGGGLGISYREETEPSVQDYAAGIQQRLAGHKLHLILEPGRFLVGNAGLLLTRIEYLKTTHDKRFAIVDAGMNDLLRPALYEAWHEIVPVTLKQTLSFSTYDVVGPVCETADFLGKDRTLAIEEGDWLAVKSAGAYGFSMSSHYNSRPCAAEVLVKDDAYRIIRKREGIEELYGSENQ